VRVGLTDAAYNSRYIDGADEAFGTDLVVASSVADHTAPELTGFSITPSSVDVSGGSATVSVAVSFSDDLSGVIEADVWLIDPDGKIVAGASISNHTSGDALSGTWSGQLTIPQFSAAGHYSVRVGLTDAAYNSRYIDGADEAFGTDLVVLTESIRPTLTINSSDADGILFAGETSTVTFHFSEAVNGFTAGDVTLSSLGTLQSFTQVDAKTYTATVVPSADGRGALSLTVGTDYTDVAGNMGTAADIAIYVDTALATVGTSKNDKLNGSANADNLLGLGGNDAVNGNDGNDWLFGGPGNDQLNGGGGNDWLFGGQQNDKLTGGTGEDTFVFNQAAFGDDTIMDFHIGEGDKVDLRGLDLSYSDLFIVQSGAHTTLITIGTDTITLNKVDASSLLESDFLL